jgi:hypothetical protein
MRNGCALLHFNRRQVLGLTSAFNAHSNIEIVSIAFSADGLLVAAITGPSCPHLVYWNWGDEKVQALDFSCSAPRSLTPPSIFCREGDCFLPVAQRG